MRAGSSRNLPFQFRILLLQNLNILLLQINDVLQLASLGLNRVHHPAHLRIPPAAGGSQSKEQGEEEGILHEYPRVAHPALRRREALRARSGPKELFAGGLLAVPARMGKSKQGC